MRIAAVDRRIANIAALLLKQTASMFKRNVAKNAAASVRQVAINTAAREMENIAARDAYKQMPFVLTAAFFLLCMLLLQILVSMCMSIMKTIATMWWPGHSADEAVIWVRGIWARRGDCSRFG